MSFHIKRTHTAQSTPFSSFRGARLSHWEKPLGGRSVLEIQRVPNPSVLLDVPPEKNPLNPPYHWHWYQEEFFTVREGRYIFTLEGKDILVSATDPQPTRIPPRARHTFRADPTCPTACEIVIETTDSPHGADDGVNERFFRNLYSYLEDCGAQGVEPRLPQLLLFLHSAEVSLAFGWGPDWLMRWVSWGMGVVIGKGLGEYVLGYRTSYPEYYDPSGEESKKGR